MWDGYARIAGTPSEKVVSYLARYANRVVIANDRLITLEDGEVCFSYKDYRDDNCRKVHHLTRWARTRGSALVVID